MSKIKSGQVSRMYGKVKSFQNETGYEYDINRTPVSYMYEVNRYNYYIDCMDFKDIDISLRNFYDLMISSYVKDGFIITKNDEYSVVLTNENINIEMNLMEKTNYAPYNKIRWNCY